MAKQQGCFAAQQSCAAKSFFAFRHHIIIIVIKAMMGGYLVYLNGKLIGDIGDKELFLKRTPTSDRLLADAELRYPYEGSKTRMHVFDKFEDADLIAELLKGMLAELPEKKPKKAK